MVKALEEFEEAHRLYLNWTTTLKQTEDAEAEFDCIKAELDKALGDATIDAGRKD